MPKVSSKRQITLPIDQCVEINILPGDEVETFVHNGQINVVKKSLGAADGALSHLKGDPNLSDEDSLQSAVDAA